MDEMFFGCVVERLPFRAMFETVDLLVIGWAWVWLCENFLANG